MKKFYVPTLLLLLVLSIAFTGCGGGGGGNSTTTSTTGLTNIRAEAALAGAPDNPIDPLNIEAGDAVQFQVAGYDSNRQRHLLASSGWTTTDNAGQAGTFNSDGSFSAARPSGGTKYTATGHASGHTYAESYQVKPVQALLTGLVFDSNGFSASHVTIIFYNSSHVEVAQVVTQFDGSFRASVPTSATAFNFAASSLPTTFYYRSFLYQTKRYSALISGCDVTLPALTNGTTTPLGTITIDASSTNGTPNPPPPPPDGCS